MKKQEGKLKKGRGRVDFDAEWLTKIEVSVRTVQKNKGGGKK